MLYCAGVWSVLGRAFRPASVISPWRSSSWQRRMLSSVQWLFLRRGDMRCASRPSDIFLTVESIHPKHSASKTTSTYGNAPAIAAFPLWQATQHSRSRPWFSSSHLRNPLRSANVIRFTISIITLDVSYPLYLFPSAKVRFLFGLQRFFFKWKRMCIFAVEIEDRIVLKKTNKIEEIK